MMTRQLLPFQYEAEDEGTGMTALAGLPAWLELGHVAGLWKSVERNVRVRAGQPGWTDAQVVSSLVMLNLAGGECVEDLQALEGDPGFRELLQRVETTGLRGRQRRKVLRRQRKGGRAVPSASAVFRYLGAFHDEEQETRREAGRAFIPTPNAALRGLARANRDFVAFVQSRSPQPVATLDMDATLVETSKRDALHSYKGFRAYQPLNTYWAEHDVLLHSEFRDGNVPAGYQQLRVLQEALENVPASVGEVRLRSDTAGYQVELLRYCAEGRHPRFGVIPFAVGADVSPELKAAAARLPSEAWKPLLRDGRDVGQEWAVLDFLPSWACYSKTTPEYRFLAIRERLPQQELPGLETAQEDLPFPLLDLGEQGRFKLHAVVTNRFDVEGDEVIRWNRARCGKSEEVHAIQKHDLAGGRLPSGRFGVNAAWWAIMVLALNLNAAMKHLVLGGDWTRSRLKALRHSVMRVAGRVVRHARQLVVKLCAAHPAAVLLQRARRRILDLALAGTPPS